MSRRILIAIVVIAALVGGGFVISKRRASSAARETQYKITRTQTGEVRKTVSSSGILTPWNVVDIKARAGGELTLLAVDVGSVVKKDQILAKIDPLDVQLALNTAQADETSARAKEKQSDATYHLQVQQSQISIKDAQASLLSAQANLAAAKARLATAQEQMNAQPELTRTAIANAQAAYDQAIRQRQQLDATNPQQLASAKAAYEQAVANRENSRAVAERQKALLAKGFVSAQTVDTAQAELNVDAAQVASTKARMDTIQAELEAGVQSADARVRQAKAALESAKASNIDIASKKNAVNEAVAAVHQNEAAVAKAAVALDQSRTNQANNAIRQYDVQQAAAAIARAQASRIDAATTLERTTVRSPSDGVILQKYVEQGTIITSGLSVNSTGTSIVQLGDVSRMYVEVTVDETDIASVDEGQNVDVSMDAYPGMPFVGKVIHVDPRAQVDQNVTTVHVRVEIDNSAATFRLLKPGMNATCQFVVKKKEDVVNVPSEAVHEDDKGRYVEMPSGGHPAPVDPAVGGQPDPDTRVGIQIKHVPVEVGIEGNDTIEITKGLKTGDEVITQTIEPAPPTAGGGGSPFGGGGGRGFGGGGGGRGR